MEKNSNRIVCPQCFTILWDGPGPIIHEECDTCKTKRKLERIQRETQLTWQDIEDIVFTMKRRYEKELDREFRKQATSQTFPGLAHCSSFQ